MATNYGSFAPPVDETDIDPATGLPRKKTTSTPRLPTQDPNDSGATVQLSAEAMAGNAAPQVAATPEGTAQGNTDVLASAQNMVLNQPGQSPLNQTYTQQAQNFAANPFGQWDPNKNKTAVMDKAQNDWANTYEAMRQKYGNVSGSGLLQQNMLQNALQHDVDMADLERATNQADYDTYLKGMQAGINTGKDVEESNQNIFSQRLGNLGTVRGMAEGERAQVTGFDQQTQLNAQNFGYDLAKMDRVFGHEDATLLANMNHEEAMVKLSAMLAEAKADNDVTRQQTIMTFAAGIDLNKMAAQFGYDTALQASQGAITQALQDNDTANAIKLMQARWDMEAGQRAEDNRRADLALAYEGKRVDYEGKQLTFNEVEAMVDAGQISPQTAADLFKQQYPDVVVTAPDPDAVQKQLKQDYINTQYQFALTHPAGFDAVAIIDDGGNFTGIRQQYVAELNKYLNDNEWGGTGTTTQGKYVIGQVTPGAEATVNISSGGDSLIGENGEPVDVATYSAYLRSAIDPTNVNHQYYQQLLSNAPALSVSISNSANNNLQGEPANNTLVNIGGRLMIVVDQGRYKGSGRDADRIQLQDLSTGTTQWFSGRTYDGNAGKSINNLADWANGLPAPATSTAGA